MKKLSFIFISLCILLYFLVFPGDALTASRRGLTLWFDQLLPTLLPFSILSYVVLGSNLFSVRSKKASKQHHIGSREWYVLLCGFLFGFPIGSKLAADLYQQKQISRKNATILCGFANNLSPVFATSVMQEMLGFPVHTGFYLILYGIPLSVCLLCLWRFGEPVEVQKNTTSRFHLEMQIVDAGIINGFETLIKICGYIMLFSILSGMIMSEPFGHPAIKLLLIGCTEVTNGLAQLSATTLGSSAKYLCAIFFLAWNGLSGFFQTASILSHTDLSAMDYVKNKLLTTLLIVGVTIPLLFFGVLV
jgi:hypothetical protein